MMNVCRLCDAEIKSGSFENIFNEMLDPPLWKTIFDLANITILQNDAYTKIVCFQCVDQLQKFHIFRKVILYTDWKRRRYNDNNINNNSNNNDNIEQVPENVDNNFNNYPSIETDREDYILEEEKIEIVEHPVKIEDQIDQNNHSRKDDLKIKNSDSNDDGIIDENDKQELKDNLAINVNDIESKIGQLVEDVDNNLNNRHRSCSSSTTGGADDILVEEAREVGQHSSEIENPINEDNFNKSINDDNQVMIDDQNETNIDQELSDDSDTVDNENLSDSSWDETNDQNEKSCIETEANRNQQSTSSSRSSTRKAIKTTRVKKVEISTTCTNNLHQCDVCKATFSSSNSLNRHLRAHSGDRSYQCAICDKKFSSKHYLGLHLKPTTIENQCIICDKTFSIRCAYHEHLKEHLQPDEKKQTNETLHQCNLCNRTFVSLLVMLTHRKIHTGEQAHKCNVCNKKYSYKRSLIDHLKRHTDQKSNNKRQRNNQTIKQIKNSETNKNKRYRCDKCTKTFSSSTGLTSHLRIHAGDRPYQCDICGKKFMFNYDLQNHLKFNDLECHCEICNETFTKKCAYREHSKVHSQPDREAQTNEKKSYQCDICNKTFTFPSKLAYHLRTHTHEKPFKCNICDKQFSHKNYLKFHLNVHTGEKRYQCDNCDRKYARKYDLKCHIKSEHSDQKVYRCTTCRKGFPSKHTLDVHSEMHYRPYQCNLCETKFTHKASLTKHMQLHTGEKPYKCNVCDKRFARSDYLKEHLRLHSKEKTT